MSDRDERDEVYGVRFGGIARLYGVSGLARLRRAHVCVVGVGGVGSWSVEALARSGVGQITMIDLDDVCVTNTNRQLPAMVDTVGLQKIDVMAARVAQINPECVVRCVHEFVLADTVEATLDAGGYDVVLDAIDDLPNKAALLVACMRRGLPVVTVGGAGGRRDPTQVVRDDLSRSGGDGLLRRTRRELRRHLELPEREGWGVPAVFSRERAVFPGADGEVCDRPDPELNLKLDCASGFGTASFVTGAFGFAAAAAVIELLTAPDRQG